MQDRRWQATKAHLLVEHTGADGQSQKDDPKSVRRPTARSSDAEATQRLRVYFRAKPSCDDMQHSLLHAQPTSMRTCKWSLTPWLHCATVSEKRSGPNQAKPL
jgi:hypothetical protein